MAVLGAEVVGLTTAVLRQRTGCNVSVYAAAVWPHTTSNALAAACCASHVVAADRVTAPFTAALEAARYRSYHAIQCITGARGGIRRFDSLALLASPPAGGNPDIESQLHGKVVGDISRMPERFEHPFAADHVSMTRDLVMERMTWLRSLLEDVRPAGGTVRINRCDSLRDVAQLPERPIFNCTGLGARRPCGDTDLRPARGQLCVLPSQPGAGYARDHGPLYLPGDGAARGRGHPGRDRRAARRAHDCRPGHRGTDHRGAPQGLRRDAVSRPRTAGAIAADGCAS